MSAPTPLEDWLAHLESKGIGPCEGCDYEWRDYRDEMPGWVRVTTAPDCQEHGGQQ